MWAVVLAVTLAGCAAQAPPAAQAPGQPFTGEVWTWDERTNVVTLRQATGNVRVKITPEQIAALKAHQVMTVRGELAPPGIEQVMLPPGTLAARGVPEVTEASGTVTSVDPAGTVTLNTDRGPMTVWIANPNTTPFRPGDRVRVRVQTQAYDVVPSRPGAPAAPSEPAAASVGTEPGEYATVKAPLASVDPQGRLTVRTPRGSVVVPVPDATRYHMGDWVEVRSAVHPAP
jgi:hypothetical protein